MLFNGHYVRWLALGIALMLVATTSTSGSEEQVRYSFQPNPGTKWQDLFCIGNEICEVGDFNGDGKDDIVTFVRSTAANEHNGDVIVALASEDGSRFDPKPQIWQHSFCTGNDVCKVGNFDGDKDDDIILFKRSAANGDAVGDVVVALSNGVSAFDAEPQVWQHSFCTGNDVCDVGDFDGDKDDDIILFKRSAAQGDEVGDVVVALSDGNSAFDAKPQLWHDSFCTGNDICDVGDFDGDNDDDIVLFKRSGVQGDERGDVVVALSNRSEFQPEPQVWNPFFCVGNEVCEVGHFDDDSRDDIILFKRSSATGEAQGDVIVALAKDNQFIVQSSGLIWHPFFCIGNEVCAVGDFNGDKRDDIITFVRDSQNNERAADVYVALSDKQNNWIHLPFIKR